MKKTIHKKLCWLYGIMFCSMFGLSAQEQKTTLPTLYITTDNNAAINSKETYVSGKMTVVSSSDTTGLYNDVMEIRGRGNSTWGLAKKPYRIKLNEKYKLLGMPAKEKSWVLLANHADKTLIRNALAFEISKACDIYYTPAYRFVDVVLNNTYIGNYMLADQIERNKNRVDLEKLDTSHITLPDISGGYLLEVDGFGNTYSIPTGANFPEAFRTNMGNIVSIKYPEEEDILAVQRNYIIQYFNTFEKTIKNYQVGTDSFSDIEQYLDVPAFVNWYIATELTANPDCIFSIYVKKHRDDDRLYFAPLWDNDISFGNCNRLYNIYDDGRSESIMVKCFSNNNFKTLVSKILTIPEIQYAIADRWEEIKPNLKNHLLTFIDSTAIAIDASQTLNFKKWNILNYVVHNELTARGSYANEVAFLKSYMGDRCDFLDGFFSAMDDTSGGDTPDNPTSKMFCPEKNVGYLLQCLLNGRYLTATKVNGNYQLGWSAGVPSNQIDGIFYISTQKDEDGNNLYYLKNRSANAYIYINTAKASIPLDAVQKTGFTLYASPNSTDAYFGLAVSSTDATLNGLGIDTNGEVVSWPTSNQKAQREYRFIALTDSFSTTFHGQSSNNMDDLSNWDNGPVNAYTRALTIAPQANCYIETEDTIRVDSIYIQAGGNIHNSGRITAKRITFMMNDTASASLENIEMGSIQAECMISGTFDKAEQWYALAFPYDVVSIKLGNRALFPHSHYHLLSYQQEENAFDTLSYNKSKKPSAGAYLFSIKDNFIHRPFCFLLDSISSYTETYDDYAFVGNMTYGKKQAVGDQTLIYNNENLCFVLQKDTDYVEIPAFRSYFTTAVGDAQDTIYIYPQEIPELPNPPSDMSENLPMDNPIKIYSTHGAVVIHHVPEGQTVYLFDMNGHKVAQADSRGKEIILPINAGVYIITVQSVYHKIIVQ